MTNPHAGDPQTGLGIEELERDQPPPDFTRGSNGAPKVLIDGRWEQFSRQSSHGDTLDEKSALHNWLISKAMEGVVLDPALQSRVAAALPYEDNKSAFTQLREDAIQAGKGRQKADIGTAVHKMGERWEQDESYDPGPTYIPVLEEYSRQMAELGLKSQLFEFQLVNRKHRTAGTCDRLFELTLPLVAPDGTVLPAGTLVIGDWKTGSSLSFSLPGYSVQLAGYAGGEMYDVEAEKFLPTPSIDQRWAIIVHLDVESAHVEFIWVDLEVGRFGAKLADEIKEWRRNWRRKEGYSATALPVKVYDADAAPAPIEDKPLDKMLKGELFAKAIDRGIDATKSMTKRDLIAALEQYGAPPAADPPGHGQESTVAEPNALTDDATDGAEPKPTQKPSRERRAFVDDPDVSKWLPWLKERLSVIQGNEEAKQWMLQRWKPDTGLVPPAKIETLEQCQLLDAFIGRVEAQFGLSFVPGRPTVEAA